MAREKKAKHLKPEERILGPLGNVIGTVRRTRRGSWYRDLVSVRTDHGWDLVYAHNELVRIAER